MKHPTRCASDSPPARSGGRRLRGALTITCALTCLVSGAGPAGGGEAQHKAKTGGQIFASVTLRINPPGADKDETVEAIIAIDPDTGKWTKLVDEGLR